MRSRAWATLYLAVVLTMLLGMIVGVGLSACQQAGSLADKGCAAIHEADQACQWITIIRADGSTVRVPKRDGIAAMRKAGLEQPTP